MGACDQTRVCVCKAGGVKRRAFTFPYGPHKNGMHFRPSAHASAGCVQSDFLGCCWNNSEGKGLGLLPPFLSLPHHLSGFSWQGHRKERRQRRVVGKNCGVGGASWMDYLGHNTTHKSPIMKKTVKRFLKV